MSQKSVLLAMLKDAGAKGVPVHDLVYRHGITRAAAIVFDLRREGYDVLTLEGKTLPDGRTELATYVLRVPMRTLAPQVAPGLLDDLPAAPPAPVAFDCGCVRSPDGRLWEVRCDAHAKGYTLGRGVVW